jgi:hypothetical protein
VDLVERAGALKAMLVDFALSDRFDREFTAVIARQFPGGLVTDEAMFTMTIDHFALQHRLPSGTTVVQEFVADHPELPAAERDMLLGWQDVVEGCSRSRARTATPCCCSTSSTSSPTGRGPTSAGGHSSSCTRACS